MDQEELERVLDTSWQAFRMHLLQSLQGHENQVAHKLDNNSPYLLASNSAEWGKDSVPLAEISASEAWDPVETGVDSFNLPVVAEVPQEVDHSTSLDSSLCLAGDAATYNNQASYLQSRIAHLSIEQQRAIRRRLRLRLGAISASKLVSGKSLHDAICALGLTRYELKEVNELVHNLSVFIGLSFSNAKSMSFINEEFLQDDFDHFGLPAWQWPKLRESLAGMTAFSDKKKRRYGVVPAKALMELLLAVDGDVHRRIFGSSLSTFQAIREVLLAGDTNRLVAELTAVRLNDLAAPPEKLHPLLLVEPVVAFLIVGNAIMMGFQTDPRWENWEGWIYFEVTFACLLLAEIICRTRFQGCRQFWCGPESSWNCFDVFLAATGTIDVIIRAVMQNAPEILGAQSVLRLCRLVRLVRIIKAFRLKCMGDLRLMVKGWLAGLWTLSLAFTLLFTVIYVISGFATMTIGSSPETAKLGLEPYFRTLPDAMFTSFRCFTGECVSDGGFPIHSLLANEFGVIFILGYVVSYMLVSMGIFNVILGVYVEITMKAAKENELHTSEQHARESVRIARVTRELLKKFAAAYSAFQEFDDNVAHAASIASAAVDKRVSHDPGLFTDDELSDDIAITKEIFLLVVQDRQVQALMNELDLPADRANLFDAIDADGSGTLQVAELVQGLLKIRGEVGKSDAVASLLVSKSIQTMIREMKAELMQSIAQFREDVRLERDESSTQTSRPWLSPPRTPKLEDVNSLNSLNSLNSFSPIVQRVKQTSLSTLRATMKPEISEAVDDMPLISP